MSTNFYLKGIYADLYKPKPLTIFEGSELINEALGLSNFKYSIPTDPQQMVYDFYYMSMVMSPEYIKTTTRSRIMGSPAIAIATAAFGGEKDEEGYYKKEPELKQDPRGISFLAQEEERLDDLVNAIQETQDTLLTYLKKDLLDATYFAICAEFRHLPDKNDYKKVLKFAIENDVGKQYAEYLKNYNYITHIGDAKIVIADKMPDDDPLKQAAIRVRLYKNPKFKKTKEVTDPVTGEVIKQEYIDDTEEFFKNEAGYIASYVAAKKAWEGDDIGFVNFAKKAFYTPKSIKWSGSYGGQPWANICNGWIKLKTQTEGPRANQNKFIWIDHIFDLAHNTGTMLNKVKRYAKNGSWNWIKQALDYKRDSTKPLAELLDKTSPQMKYLGRLIRFAVSGETEEFDYMAKAKKTKIATNIAGKFKFDVGYTAKSATSTDNFYIIAEILKKPAIAHGPGGLDGVVVATMDLKGEPKPEKYGLFKLADSEHYYVIFPNAVQATYQPITQFIPPTTQPVPATGDFTANVGDQLQLKNGMVVKVVQVGSTGKLYTEPDNIPPGEEWTKDYILKFNKEKNIVGFIEKGDFQVGKKTIAVTPTASPAPEWKIITRTPKAATAEGQDAIVSKILNINDVVAAVKTVSNPNTNVVGAPSTGTELIPLTPASTTTKSSSTPIKWSGPAGKAGIKSLIITGGYGKRESYSGYLKIERWSQKYLYHNAGKTPASSPWNKGIHIPSYTSSKTPTGKTPMVAPKNDKAVVKNLMFDSLWTKFADNKFEQSIVLLSGTIYGATITKGMNQKPYIIVRGPVRFVNCYFEPGAIGIDPVANVEYDSCVNQPVTDPNDTPIKYAPTYSEITKP